MKHTPGPWQSERRRRGYKVDIWSTSEHKRIATITNDDETWDDKMDRQRANTTLIAAAPEMLEALKAISEELLQEGFFPDSATAKVWTAIAKAEGKQ